jgi:hypothetical protein
MGHKKINVIKLRQNKRPPTQLRKIRVVDFLLVLAI